MIRHLKINIERPAAASRMRGYVARTIFLLLLFCAMAGFARAQTIYVDNRLAADCNGNYSIADRDCSGSDGDAYGTLAAAAAVAVPGTQVLIRGGVYREQLSPRRSGEPGAYITYKNYPGEVVEITGSTLSPAVWIDRKDYIAIEGLQIRNVRRWLNALGSDYLILRDNVFEKALDSYGSSKTGVFMQGCRYARILNNKLHDTTQDNLGMVDCDYNLIEGNSITKAEHSLWALKCSNFNIVRNNYFHNELQKIGEIYDCDSAGYGNDGFPKLNSEDDAKYNVVEGNVFAYTPSSGDSSPYAGIQYAAQNGIIRNNIFYECVGPPFDFTLYGGEAKYNYGNRVYHNVFYDNDFGGVSITGNTSYTFGDQKVKNNLFYKNRFVQNDMRWSWYAELNDKPVQIFTGRTDGIVFENNNIFHSQKDELYVIAYGSRFSSSNPAPQPLSWWQANHAQMFSNNVQEEPKLTDADGRDFRLQPDSPMIDAGAFLAKTVGSGSGVNLPVDDAGWFIDGFGIVDGDTIQVEGQSEPAVIVSVDYDANILTLDRSLSWHAGQKVSMKYNGAAPDIGAFEFDNATFAPTEQGSVTQPESFGLSGYPNPFNPSAAFRYVVPVNGHVSLTVYDMTGRRVAQLLNEFRAAGEYTLAWNAVAANGMPVASGVYFVRLSAQGFAKTIKMMYLQ